MFLREPNYQKNNRKNNHLFSFQERSPGPNKQTDQDHLVIEPLVYPPSHLTKKTIVIIVSSPEGNVLRIRLIRVEGRCWAERVEGT